MICEAGHGNTYSPGLTVASREIKRTAGFLRLVKLMRAWESHYILLIYPNFRVYCIGHLIYLFWILILPSSLKDLGCLARDTTDSVNLACILAFVSLLVRPA